MNVDVNHPGCALGFEQISHHAGAYRFAAAGHAVLASIGEIGDNNADTVDAGSAEGVQVKQQLHQVVIHRD